MFFFSERRVNPATSGVPSSVLPSVLPPLHPSHAFSRTGKRRRVKSAAQKDRFAFFFALPVTFRTSTASACAFGGGITCHNTVQTVRTYVGTVSSKKYVKLMTGCGTLGATQPVGKPLCKRIIGYSVTYTVFATHPFEGGHTLASAKWPNGCWLYSRICVPVASQCLRMLIPLHSSNQP